MWVIFDYRLEEREFFEMTGKALFLCQHFEHTCKEIVMYLNLAKALSEQQLEFLSDDHKKYADKLMALFLGGSIKRLRKEFPRIGSDAEIGDIEKAKDSRNYICHESELDLIGARFAPRGYRYEWQPNTDILVSHFRNIATGDYVVSRWFYEFSEKESGAFKVKDEYVESLIARFLNDGKQSIQLRVSLRLLPDKRLRRLPVN